MELNITGPVTEKQQRMIARAVDFFMDKLVTKRLKNKLYIDLEVVKNLSATQGVMGDATWEDENVRPKDFTVRVDWRGKNFFEDTLVTLAHELVHVKQFARGEMTDLLSAKKVKWNGKRYDRDDVDYWDLPWEIEAHGRERGLFVRLCENDKEISSYCGY
jgi:hypothetical protein